MSGNFFNSLIFLHSIPWKVGTCVCVFTFIFYGPIKKKLSIQSGVPPSQEEQEGRRDCAQEVHPEHRAPADGAAPGR